MATQTTSRFVLQSATIPRGVADGPFVSLPPPDRIRLMQGQLVEVIALLPDGREVIVGKEYLRLLQATWTTLKEQLANLAAPGLYVSQITHLVIPVTSDTALATMMWSVRQGLQHKGSLPQFPHQGKDSLFRNAQTCEVATAVGFGYVLDQIKPRIDRTFYRGGNHYYKAPIAELKMVYGAENSQVMNYVKAKLVESVVKSYLDYNLANNKDVVTCMHEILTFGDAVRDLEAREKTARAQAAARKAEGGAKSRKPRKNED